MAGRPRIHVNSRSLSLGAVVLCATILVAYLFITGEIRMLPQALTWPRSAWIILGVALMFVGWLVEAYILDVLARPIEHPLAFGAALRSTFVLVFFNNVTPFSSGGQAMQSWSLWRHGGLPFGESIPLILNKFLLYQLVLSGCCVASVLYAWPLLDDAVVGINWIVGLAFLVQLVILAALVGMMVRPRTVRHVVGLVFSALKHTPLREKSTAASARITSELVVYEKSAGTLIKNPRDFLKLLLLTFVQLQFVLIVPYCICRAMGVTPPLLQCLAATAFVIMVSASIPTPGGAGGAEGMFAVIFSLFFPAGTSVAVAVLMWRVVTFYLPILVCSPFCIGASKAKTADPVPEDAPTKAPSGKR